jgi:hypothetical protein
MTPPLSRREFLRNAALAGASVALLPQLGRVSAAAGEGEWLVGDLHCHTVFSHDVWGGPDDDNTEFDEAYTLGWTAAEQIAIAELRGLDFLAITDHDDVRALTDPGYRSQELTLIRGYEHSLSKGHAGCLGITEVLDIDTASDAGALALRDAVHERGGTFILNHPFYADGWRYSPSVVPDSIEVWNIAWPYRHIAPELVDNVPPEPAVADNYKSLPYWEKEFLSKGRMPATGGSDNHYRATTAAQGVGQPATWVYARDRTPEAILEAIRAGRTFVAAEPPSLGGITLDLTARSGTGTWMVGDTVPANAGAVAVSARVANAPAHRIVFVVDGVAREPELVPTLDQTFEITLDAAAHDRVRVEVFLDQGYWMGALTSPIYFGA